MKKFLFFAAALLGLVACNNQEEVKAPIVPGELCTLTANVNFSQGSNSPIRTVAPDTPVPTAEDATVNFHWEKGDQVMLVSKDSTEKHWFTIDDSSIQGTTANFTGIALTDMSSYKVYYAGKSLSEELVNIMIEGGCIELTNAANNYNIICGCPDGNASGFTINMFYSTMRLLLTGDGITLGSVKYYCNYKDTKSLSTTINFGTTGLALSSTAQEVWVPMHEFTTDLTLRFYDTNGELIMEKSMSWVASPGINTLFSFPELEVKGDVDVEWVQLWKDGPKWATCNVGATTVTGYGDYFCWGGFYANGAGKAFQDDHNTGNSDIQYGDYDTAKKKWGGKWQMPTKTDFNNLMSNTTGTKVTNYNSSGVSGYVFTGKGDYAENSIFLPAAGYCDEDEVDEVNSYGYYWCSTPYTYNNQAYIFFLEMDEEELGVAASTRDNAYPIRAILRE